MIHEPSDYKTTIEMNIQQIIEVHKAISARISYLSFDPKAKDENMYPHREEDISNLLEIAQVLEDHTNIAVDAWEEKVARAEAKALEDYGAFREWLDGETGVDE